MTDRSANMRAIRSKDMGPELAVRRIVHQLGYRYRLHRNDLPGRPDIIFTSRHKIIFVHGCFWHSHGCKNSHIPKSNVDYWVPKLIRNTTRDAKNLQILSERGWQCLVIWECEIKDRSSLTSRIRDFFRDNQEI